MKQRPNSRRRRSSAKSVLRLLDLEHAKTAVLNSLNSTDAKRGYRHAIDEFVDCYCSEPRAWPSSAAVNPALTIIANAMRVGDHLLQRMGATTAAYVANKNVTPEVEVVIGKRYECEMPFSWFRPTNDCTRIAVP